jgi:predicted transcriptional regulator
MTRTASPTLTDAEMRIMRVLWSRGESTNLEIVEAIVKPRLARNTVMTTLGVLERKGYVAHRTDGRTFIYRAVVVEDVVRGKVIESVLHRFFGGSAEELVVKLLDAKYISNPERRRIQALLDQAHND